MMNEQYSEMLFQEFSQRSAEHHMIALPGMLGAKFSKDGNMYSWLLGDNLQDGVAGFGNTAYAATVDFYDNFHNQQAEPPQAKEERDGRIETVSVLRRAGKMHKQL